MRRKILTLCLLCILVFTTVGCQANSVRSNELDIAYIYVAFSENGYISPEYKIDLKSGQFYAFYSGADNRRENRDSLEKNEGFYHIKNLKNKKINDFIDKCKIYGFIEWEESYMVEDPLAASAPEGTYIAAVSTTWTVSIVYCDGTEKIIRGNYSYPDTWTQMGEAFQDMTGVDVLSGEIPAELL